MHVFLTGEVQIGKSTVVRRTAERLNRPVYGFRTFFTDRASAEKSLYMLPAAAQRAPAMEDTVAVFSGGRPTPLPTRFDAIGGALLRQARQHPQGLILMDECGRFEREAYAFQREIARCLDGDIPVLGVVRQGVLGWTELIRSHPRVTILTVTAENRLDLPQQAAALLMKGENHAGFND